MSQTLTTDVVAPRDRLGYWVDGICSTYVDLECEAGDDGAFGGSIVNHALPGLDLSVVSSQPQRVMRTPRMISRAEDDFIIVSLQTRGRGMVSQDGRDAAMLPGDFAIYDTARPYTLRFGEPFEEIVLKVRSSRLRALVSGCDRLTAITISGQSSAGRLMGSMVRALKEDADELPPTSAASMVNGLVSVLVGGLQSLSSNQPSDPSALHAYHLARIKRCIDELKHDPALRIERVAAEMGLSSSHLHRLFAAEPQTPAQYLWSRRLAACEQDLLDPRKARLSVSEIAFAWGFNDAAHFSRAFKDRYGQSPRAWRKQAPTSVGH